MSKTILGIVVVVSVIVAISLVMHSRPSATTSVAWKYDYDEAIKAAQAANKPLLVDFYTDWCGWCKKLDQDTYTDKDVEELSARFVCVKVDAERRHDLVEKYRIDGYPAILFLDSKSNETKRIGGYEEPKRFLQDMQDALGTPE